MVASTAFSIGTKALQAIASFATVHRLVELWGQAGYGLWVTLTAFALYISLFDMGVGYGVKNRVSEAWGRGNLDDASATVRAGMALYAVAASIALVFGVLVVGLVAPFKDHMVAAGILWFACVVAFFLSYQNTLLQGLARFKGLALLSLIAPVTWFALIRCWPRGAALPLELGAAVYSAALVLQGLATWLVSRRAHGFRIAAWHRTRPVELRPLLRTGVQFLVLQLAAFVLNGSGTFLVYRSLGGAETAQYDAANKVFSIFTVAFSTLIAIAWTEISRAKAAHNHRRLANVHRLLYAVVGAFSLVVAAVCYSSAPLTHALTGISVPTHASIAFAAFVVVQMAAFASAVFLNAFERLRVQIIVALLAIPAFFIVALGLLSAGWGMPSIPIASAIAMLPSLVVCHVVARRLIWHAGGNTVRIVAFQDNG